MAKTIQVSQWVYDQLTEIKDEKDHQSFDSAIRDLLRDGHGVVAIDTSSGEKTLALPSWCNTPQDICCYLDLQQECGEDD